MRSGANKENAAARPNPVSDLVDQQEIPTDVTLAKTRPFAFQRMIAPLRAERGVIGDQ